VTCPALGGVAYTGTDAYKGGGKAAPLRGAVGCVDQAPLAKRPKGRAGNNVLDASNIYGPMEAGFSKAQPGARCLGAGNGLPDFELPGGVDTNVAEAVMVKACEERGIGQMGALLDYCGGHASPFHYHERMNCLYDADPSTGHSTRIGTAADGNGIYGHNVAGGCEPTDLDWCGGRTGVTPDSNGQEVYYYVVSNRAPFALACFGPINSEAECRALYPECDGVAQSFTTGHGTDSYDLDCPCFNPTTGGNMPGQGKPAFLGPNGFDAYELDLMEGDAACTTEQGETRACTQEEKDAAAALYSSQKCASGGGDTPTPSGTWTAAAASNCASACGQGDGSGTPGSVTCSTGSDTGCDAGTKPSARTCPATAACPSSGGGGGGSPQPRPNFIIFQPDDLPFYWDDAPTHPAANKNPDRDPTPHLDRIRSEGAVFTRAYTTSPMCAPSRYSVLTGRFAERSKYAQAETTACDASNTVVDVQVPKTKLDEEQADNLATTLKAAGYATGVAGKWHVSAEGTGNPYTSAGAYAAATTKALATGMDSATGFYVSNLDGTCNDGACKDTPGFSHNMEWVTAAGLAFIDTAVATSKPFFLYFNPTVPHSPSVSEALFEISIRKTPGGDLDSDPASGMPPRTGTNGTSVKERAEASVDGTDANGKKKEAAYAAVWIDDAMGALYAKLKALNVLNDTLILFVMDHGASGKSTLYETGGRIAMFARYPNHAGNFFAAGASHDFLVSNMDIAPTLVQLANIPSTDGSVGPSDAKRIDGTSLLVSNRAAERALFLSLGKDRAVVTNTGKMIVKNVEGYGTSTVRGCTASTTGNSGHLYPGNGDATQVYDLSADPTEQTNLASASAGSSPAALQAKLKTLLDCHVENTKIGSTVFEDTCQPTATIPPSAVPAPSSSPASTIPPSAVPAPSSSPASTIGPGFTENDGNTAHEAVALVMVVSWASAIALACSAL
jgi:arylsulfatase A-like enzyme